MRKFNPLAVIISLAIVALILGGAIFMARKEVKFNKIGQTAFSERVRRVEARKPIGDCHNRTDFKARRNCVLDLNDASGKKPSARQESLETYIKSLRDLGNLGGAQPEINPFTVGEEYADIWLLKLQQCQFILEEGCPINSRPSPPFNLVTPDVAEYIQSIDTMDTIMDTAITQ